MANTLIQFRAEETSKIEASMICKRLGIDLPTYLRMCVARLIQENGVPFDMKLAASNNNCGEELLRMAGGEAQKNGVSDISLEEINAEIDAVRNGK